MAGERVGQKYWSALLSPGAKQREQGDLLDHQGTV